MSFAGWKPLPGVPSRLRPVGDVRTPTTFSPCTRSDSTGKPVNRLTPRPSAFSPSQRATSLMLATKLPWFFMGGGVGIRHDPPDVRT
jgi:hypothetical protein